MDKIYIRDLEFIGYHGVFEEEKKLGQKFYLSLELSTDLREANDDITKTTHYGEVAEASLGNYYFHLRRSCFYDSGQRVVGLRLDSYYGRRYLSGLFHDFETCVFNCLFISFDLYNFSHCSD